MTKCPEWNPLLFAHLSTLTQESQLPERIIAKYPALHISAQPMGFLLFEVNGWAHSNKFHSGPLATNWYWWLFFVCWKFGVFLSFWVLKGLRPDCYTTPASKPPPVSLALNINISSDDGDAPYLYKGFLFYRFVQWVKRESHKTITWRIFVTNGKGQTKSLKSYYLKLSPV